MEFQKECIKIGEYQEADVHLGKIMKNIRNWKSYNQSVGDLYKIWNACIFQRNIMSREVWKVHFPEKLVEKMVWDCHF